MKEHGLNDSAVTPVELVIAGKGFITTLLLSPKKTLPQSTEIITRKTHKIIGSGRSIGGARGCTLCDCNTIYHETCNPSYGD